jgi:hypothetical protein
MVERETNRTELAEVHKQLAWWRGRYGGRGRPIPEELWAGATEVAGTLGVDATARALGLDRARLALRLSASSGGVVQRPSTRSRPTFVELEARQATPSRGQVVVRLVGREGDQMEISGSAVDVTSVVREVWRPSR